MNVYDFDGTIYRGDSTIDFYFYELFHHPYIFVYLPRQIYYFILFKFKLVDKVTFKEQFFKFVCSIHNIQKDINSFWDKHQKKIEGWYLLQQQPTDVIISASPYFLLKPICDRLAISTLIATEVNKLTGKFETPNCYGQEKVTRFYSCFPNGNIKEFYSDSISDAAMANIAQSAYIVHKGVCSKWFF